MKTKRTSRIISVVLCIALMLSIAVQGISSVSAASVYENENLVQNPGFEINDLTTDNRDGHWGTWQTVTRTDAEKHSGSYSVALSGNDPSLEQDVKGLVVGNTYVYTMWAKLSSEGATASIGVKNYGGDELKVFVNSTTWTQYTITFTYLSGSPRIYAYMSTSNGATFYVDDASVTIKSDIKRAEIQNGKIDIEFADSYTGTPSASNFSANYSTNLNSEVKELALTGEKTDGGFTLNFEEIPAAALEQTVTVDLSFGGNTITLDYTIAADDTKLIVAELESVSAENGTVTAVLTEDPTVAPIQDDFTLTMLINGETAPVTVSGFSYDSASKTITLTVNRVSGSPEEDRTIEITVSYNGKQLSDTFVVEKGTAKIYYVSNSGNDNNDGTSEATPFATIDKLNTLTFNPGDQILFKKGDEFKGTFKPSGSGVEGYPIVIASYGEGSDRPVLHPAEQDWALPHLRSADTLNQSGDAMANGCIYLYNVEYWEVRDLELEDESFIPGFYAVDTFTTYSSGIRVGNLNMGDLTHFYFDNLVIHGFRGPGSNLGKTSGGINFNVYVTKDPSVDVPSALVDMRVTNCEIYNCGRSGINFLNAWAYRTEEKWGGCGTGNKNYPYYPHRDFYMANNLIHDIDGDGLIVDNVSNSVVEYNLCYRTAIHLGSMGAAVGFFNWNSDDTVFQYNEVYNTGLNATQNNGSIIVPGDSMGIEVDALNDRTWVQYNYIHDNYGGFMMWCNVGATYKGFDAIVRYNISESDRTARTWGYLRFCGWEYGSEFYNNILYFDPDTCLNSAGDINLVDISSGNHQSRGHAKLYNNIFYYTGDQPKAANTFSDTIANYIDWQANIFYGFTNLPTTRNEAYPNISADPLFTAPGTGVDGTVPGEFCDLTGYEIAANSPAINAGVPLASMWDKWGGKDFFGNELTAIPDIGVYDSGATAFIVTSFDYEIDQTEKTATVSADTLISELFDSLVYEGDIDVGIFRNGVRLAGEIYLVNGDIIKAVDKDGNELVYTIIVNSSEAGDVIPVEHYTVTAGASETTNENAPASNAIDENESTMWHTPWYDTNHDNHYITIELDGAYTVTGYTYLPRQSGTNGIILDYQILAGDSEDALEVIASGTWANNSDLKTVTFSEPVQAKYFRLKANKSGGDGAYAYASAAEIRLVGERIYDTTDIPDAPVNVRASRISGTSAEISWNAPEDSEGITKYIVKDGDKVLGTVTANTFSFVVGGLEKNTEYTFSVYAQNDELNLSEPANVTFTTNNSDEILDVIIGTLGDVNRDGNITSLDATIVLQYAAGIVEKDDPRYNYSAADVNSDGSVTSLDATYILQKAAGIIEKF